MSSSEPFDIILRWFIPFIYFELLLIAFTLGKPMICQNDLLNTNKKAIGRPNICEDLLRLIWYTRKHLRLEVML